ncbi:MAG: aldo/keto reductase [Hellea sp.]|nr:aldo/keto reductase [Hellea sp.]
MEFRPLGRTNLKVTSVCLGTMTWGQQNSEAEAHEQLSYAISERGINFIDTAEMYPVPGDPRTQGRTEEYIGSWLKARGKRDDLVIASKITGRSQMVWCRDKNIEPRHTRVQIDEAVEKSLRRFQTDYIDLYQLHWPDRAIPGFGFHAFYDYDAEDMVPLEDILESLSRHVEKGNIRHIGVSNEYPWAVMKFLAIAESRGWPRMVSNQCVYNLVSRRFDYSAAEIAMREQVGLLAYSPLAQGYLTGKYEGGKLPAKSRKALFGGFLGRYEGPGAADAIQDCLETARNLGLTPAQFALKFVETRQFVTSNIIGATTMAQLKENIDAHEIEWTSEMEQESRRIQKVHRSPCP